MTTRDRGLAALTRAYAKLAGKSLRTAQRERNSNSEGWARFKSLHSTPRPGFSDVSPADAPPPPEPLGENPSRPEIQERDSWRLWCESFAAWMEAVERGDDSVTCSALAQGVSKLRADYDRARLAKEQWQISQRQIFTMAEWNEMLGSLESIFGLLKSAPDEIALSANPASPATARAAIQRFLSERFEVRAKAILEKVIASPFPA
jgi:hypothetical protein